MLEVNNDNFSVVMLENAAIATKLPPKCKAPERTYLHKVGKQADPIRRYPIWFWCRQNSGVVPAA